MKVSDYVAKFLKEQNVKHVFGITGGAIVHVFDSIGKTSGLEYICTHHEQAAAMAADAYSRVTKNLGVGIATSGPGATNLLTGVCCSYFDSIPTLFITGQVPRSQIKGKSKCRQIGFQETNIVDTFKPNTKYATIILNPEDIRYELEKSVYLAKNGRPGPVLIDLPDDVQRADINPENLKGYVPSSKKINQLDLEEKVSKAIELIEGSERPVIIFGAGVKRGMSEHKAREFADRLGIPVALTWGAIDLFPDDYPLSVRDFGVTANRPGNFTVQNSDLILAIGTRLDTHETGSNLESFAREAKRVVVDIDNSELEKYFLRGFPIDIAINYNTNDFFNSINSKLGDIKIRDISGWKEKIRTWKLKYPINKKEYFSSDEQVNPYVFLNILSEKSSSRDIIIPEAGCNVTWAFQGFKVKEGQRLFTSYNHSPMGYGIPAAIGACFANNKERVITLVGDGGIMMNEQEMATITNHNLPIKIFLMNNEGYGMIKQTQETWLNSRYEASTKKSFHLPDFIQLAKAHGIKNTEIITCHSNIESVIEKSLNYKGSVLCDVRIHPISKIHPKLSFGRPIEDSEPLLDRGEFNEQMIVKPYD